MSVICKSNVNILIDSGEGRPVTAQKALHLEANEEGGAAVPSTKVNILDDGQYVDDAEETQGGKTIHRIENKAYMT